MEGRQGADPLGGWGRSERMAPPPRWAMAVQGGLRVSGEARAPSTAPALRQSWRGEVRSFYGGHAEVGGRHDAGATFHGESGDDSANRVAGCSDRDGDRLDDLLIAASYEFTTGNRRWRGRGGPRMREDGAQPYISAATPRSKRGEIPNFRENSRLNWLGLSYPTS